MNPYVIPGIRKEDKPNMVNRVIEVVLNYKGYVLAQVATKSRKRDLVYTRQLIEYYLCMENTYSLKRIGKVFGFKRDHTTVIHSRQTIRNLMENNEQVLHDVRNINELLNNQA